MTELVLLGLFISTVIAWVLVTILARMSDPVGMNRRQP
jgi:hypothetical protein